MGVDGDPAGGVDHGHHRELQGGHVLARELENTRHRGMLIAPRRCVGVAPGSQGAAAAAVEPERLGLPALVHEVEPRRRQLPRLVHHREVHLPCGGEHELHLGRTWLHLDGLAAVAPRRRRPHPPLPARAEVRQGGREGACRIRPVFVQHTPVRTRRPGLQEQLGSGNPGALRTHHLPRHLRESVGGRVGDRRRVELRQRHGRGGTGLGAHREKGAHRVRGAGGQRDGRGEGLVEVEGDVDARHARIGEVALLDGKGEGVFPVGGHEPGHAEAEVQRPRGDGPGRVAVEVHGAPEAQQAGRQEAEVLLALVGELHLDLEHGGCRARARSRPPPRGHRGRSARGGHRPGPPSSACTRPASGSRPPRWPARWPARLHCRRRPPPASSPGRPAARCGRSRRG